ncbi:MAG: hypothetical protein HUJ66_08500 [Oscillospiraceae bacterium]|nr:hypothetical protein [Oscillospiraceae bacterium]
MNKIKKRCIRYCAVLASRKSGREAKEIENDMRMAELRLDVGFGTYMAKKLYRRSYSELRKEYDPKVRWGRFDTDIDFVARYRDISYGTAKKEMDRLREKHDILYKEYTGNRLFECTDRKSLKKKLKRIAEKNEKYLREVCADTGWSYEKAKSEAARMKKLYDITYKQYSRYRFYAMSEDEVKEKLLRWKENANACVNTAAECSGWSRSRVRRHMKRYGVLYDIIQPYYVLYRAWELSDREMDSYARQKNSETLWRRFNDRSQARILAEKHRFDEVYAEYTGRRFWINRDSSFEEFCAFAEGLEYIFCKPIESGGGLGTEKHRVTEDLRGLYDMLMGKDRLLVEECITQHPEIDEFIPGCCCTIRVVVLQDGEGIHTICAGMRFGHEGITDNFSHDGMVADIDIETGVIVTDAVDKKGHVYDRHPVSGKTFKGFRVPNWDMVRSVTENAMNVLEGINYVGWDVAVCEDKAVLVEGNAMPDLVLIQAPYAPARKGMKYLFDPWLNKEE